MKYSKIKDLDIANGVGLRVSLFVSGCPHHCYGCFNPETWNEFYGQDFTDQTISDILELCANPHIAGLSLLGGEPLTKQHQDALMPLLLSFKANFPKKTIWCYTGYTWKQISKSKLMEFIDVLVDGKFVLELKNPKLRFKGSENQRIIDVQKSLESKKMVLWDE